MALTTYPRLAPKLKKE